MKISNNTLRDNDCFPFTAIDHAREGSTSFAVNPQLATFSVYKFLISYPLIMVILI